MSLLNPSGRCKNLSLLNVSEYKIAAQTNDIFCILPLLLGGFVLFSFIVGKNTEGILGGKKETTQKNLGKNTKKKNIICHCRCVTLLLPYQDFTTELTTKGTAPCSPLWPGEQYGSCE